MSPDQYCREKLASTASSAYYSLLFLPVARRRAATALYALRRELDEAVENASDPTVARAGLSWWAQEIQRLFEQTPQHPVTRALAPHVPVYGLSPAPFALSLQARLRQLEPEPFDDFDALAQHCYLLAAPFGEMAAMTFGAVEPATRAHARELALAIQMILMVRDAGRCARKGRIVFPLRDLRDFDVKPQDLSSARYVEGFGPLASRQAQRARAALRSAAAQLPATQRRDQAPGIILGALYETLLDELERSDFRVLHQRIALTPVRKLLIAWRTWMFGPPGRGALAQ
ncbi:MAG TPA: squalene/phytoene synthase family protein [Burkholderiaceae bacterium]|jgi:phytoene synthase|nr:squalene/phytoene synthase family protein [Burkholderiaceae bacterium]